MDAAGNIFIGFGRHEEFHHSSLMRGEPVAGAGEITFKNGKIIGINNKSGHYLPTETHFQQTLQRLAELNPEFNIENLRRINVNLKKQNKFYDWIWDILLVKESVDEF